MDRYWRGAARTVCMLVLAVWAGFCSRFAYAGPGTCDPWVVRAVSIQGTVETQPAGRSGWLPAKLDQTYCPGDTLRVLANSRAAVELRNETIIRLDQNTTIVFHAIETTEPSWLDLLRGAVHFISRVPRSLKVRTPFVNAAIEGTEFLARVEYGRTFVTVFGGQVAVENLEGRLLLASGQSAVTESGKAPVLRLDVRPEDAVRWTLYYPAILPGPGLNVPAELVRAQDLLSVGRVDEAEAAIRRVLAKDPTNAAAHGLNSVIALAQNRKNEAMELAQRADELEPKSAAAGMALSFALQAQFDLKQAEQVVAALTEFHPEDALLWARLAELRLSLGELKDALAAAQTAVRLNPALERTQTVLGFSNLTRIKLDQATAAFQSAIELNQAAPLPRLGLGLAKIRRGRLTEGRRDIEIATTLDPNNALIRSYLGKAYYEERRDALAGEQYSMAKGMDPKDPTAWFYSAILKQQTNRPVEALLDLEQSIELNGNRAVFRSALLLDQDAAARSVSLARIYRDLGFDQRALVEGWKSVNTDPGDYAAHRFLADSYVTKPRHEIARVSELLQSQLLQPLNTTPLQPQLADATLLILPGAGPSALGFNEFNRLFVRNGPTLQLNGVAGNDDTWGNDSVVSGIYNRLSYSVGQFHFETDGFRKNNDLEQDIYNLFGQYSLTPRVNLQAEFRRNDTENGDLDLLFDPDIFSPENEQSRDENIYRVGLRFSPSVGSNLLLSGFKSSTDREVRRRENAGTFGGLPAFLSLDTDEDIDAYQVEARYLSRKVRYDYTFGGGYYKADTNAFRQGTLSAGPIAVPLDNIETFDTKHWNVYLYSHFSLLPSVTLVGGLSYDSFKDEPANGAFNEEQVNPKAGLLWDLSSRTTLRVAGFRASKRSLAVGQTLEPTEVAGFNQFFDDPLATDATRYGIGLDHQFTRTLLAGIEFSRRDLDVPLRSASGGVNKESQDERLGRAYGYWAPDKRLALGASVEYEDFDRNPPTTSFRTPNDLKTLILPVSASYFHPNGLFAKLRGSYLRQDIESGAVGNDDDQNWIVDGGIGYRLPKRRGIITLEVRNLLDENFSYHSVDFQNGTFPRNRFIPERTVLVRAQFGFY